MPKVAWKDWSVLAVWMTVIFVLSATPDLRSGLVSGLDLVLRKLAHITEYAILGWLANKAFRSTGFGPVSSAVAALIFCIVYAATDEWHQTFIKGRHGAPLDVFIDTIGIGLGIVLHKRRR